MVGAFIFDVDKWYLSSNIFPGEFDVYRVQCMKSKSAKKTSENHVFL